MKHLPSFKTVLITLYLSSVLPLLLGLGFVLYLEYRTLLIQEHEATLRDLINVLVEPQPSATFTLRQTAELLNTQLRHTDFQAVVVDPTGRWYGDGPPLLTATEHTTLRTTGVPVSRLVQTDAGEYLVYSRALFDADGRVSGVVEGQFPIAAVTPDLAQVTQWLALTIGGAILLLLGLTPLVVHLAIRPLRTLLQTAHAVGSGQLAVRSPLPGVREFGELANTINAMLDRIERTLRVETQTADQLRRFVADASHELRTPLAVFGHGLDLLQEALRRQDHDQVQHTLLRLKREQESMRRLVNDLLLLAKMEQLHAAPLRYECIEPVPFLEEMTERAQMMACGQHIRLQWPAATLPAIEADPEALRRALSNLVENAIRHTPPGRTITLSVYAGNAEIGFVVADEGEGIATEHLQRLGERFYRIDGSRSRNGGGTGLGLAIVKAIAAAHGGRLEIASAPGHGTTVRFVIPVSRPHISVARESGHTAASSAGKTTVKLRQPFSLTLRGWIALGGILGALVLLIGLGYQARPVLTPFVNPAEPFPAGNRMLPLPPEHDAGRESFILPPTGYLDQAADMATQVSGGVAISIFFNGRHNPFVEVMVSDGSLIRVDTRSMVIQNVRPGPQGRGRGVERQRREWAELAAMKTHYPPPLGFDDVHQIARQAEIVPSHISLFLIDDQLVYLVEGDRQRMLIDAYTGAFSLNERD